jgi:cytidylate kinase
MMPHGASVGHFVDALDRAQRHWQARHAAEAAGPTAAAATIAVSREAGVPGTSIARAVGDRLGWAVYDHELLEEIARQMGLRVSLLESVDERRRGWLQESLSDIFAVPSVNENTYVRHLTETMLSLAAHGECVIVGRGATVILPATTTLRVRVIGNREDRIAGTSYRLGVSREEAIRWIDETEQHRRAFAREHFLKDLADPLNYDLILNTSRWTIPECTELIVDALHRLESRLPAK